MAAVLIRTQKHRRGSWGRRGKGYSRDESAADTARDCSEPPEPGEAKNDSSLEGRPS